MTKTPRRHHAIPARQENGCVLRNATRNRIFAILLRKIHGGRSINAATHEKFLKIITDTIENILWTAKSSLEDYANVETLVGRVGVILRRRHHHMCAAATAATYGISSPLTTGVGCNRSIVPPTNGPMTSQEVLGATHVSTLSQPFLQPLNQSNMHRYSMSNVGSSEPSNRYPYGVVMSSSFPNPMPGVDATATSHPSNLEGMQQTPLPKRQPEYVRSFSALTLRKSQTVSPRNTVERKHLRDGSYTSSKQVNEDSGQPPMVTKRWLLFMIHARHCMRRKDKCSSTRCSIGKYMLKHIDSCKVPDCTYKNCLRTRQWFHHYKQCKKKTCHPCDFIRNFKEKKKDTSVSLRRFKCSSPSSQCQPMKPSEPRQAYKGGAEAPSVDADLQPLMKRPKLQRPSQNATPETKTISVTGCNILCKSLSSLNMQENDECKTIEIDGMPMHLDIPDASGIPVTRELENHVAEAPSVDVDLQASLKHPMLQLSSQNAIPETKSILVTGGGVLCKPHSSMNMQEKDGLKIDECKSVTTEVMPMDMDVPDVSEIHVTRELEKNVFEAPSVDADLQASLKHPKLQPSSQKPVAEDTPKGKSCGGLSKDDKISTLLAQEKSRCMNEVSPSMEENVKQSVDVVDAPKMEITSLVELFTPEQVNAHICSLLQWVGQSKTKAGKNKAISADSCQLCSVERLVFEPIPIYCSPCGARIKKKALHYSTEAGESRHHVCVPCYNKAPENLVSLEGNCIPKERLEKKKNEEEVGERWVKCDKCEGWQHQICALFNNRKNSGDTKYTCPYCYVQEVEQGERRPLPPSAIPGAKSLPVTALSNHIEDWLFKKLKEERLQRALTQGKSFEEVPGAESLTVRVVASVDKVLEVKERFLELFREENYPSKFPYKSKVILLLQKIENVEVCLFAMFVQEFGTESGPPNQRRVYLSYLDSVKYFRPEVKTVSGEALRTFVYHEIMIGYLDYCKTRGFTSCYIWACPPLKGDDYIFSCHPGIQKIPKNAKLREWYLTMLRKAAKEDVVVECTNLYDQFFVQSGECRANVTAARLPYFDGDYWPRIAEDYIRQMSQEDDVTKLKSKKDISKRDLRAVGQLDIPDKASKDQLMMQKLGEIICPTKEDYIMVHLQHCCKHCSTLMVSGNRWVCNQCKNFQICDKCYEMEQNRIDKERHPINHKEKHTLSPVAIKDIPAEIKDKDDNLESKFFDSRQAFLNLCQGNHYQYNTLRRAKHSSMMVLYHLHNPTAPQFATFCTICQQEVENSQGWHCEVCPCYDVCNACYLTSFNHPHNLKSRSSSTDSNVVQQNGQTNQNYQIQLEKLKEILVHVVVCCSKLCQYQYCSKWKNLFRHSIECKTPRDCHDCRRLWIGLKAHAHNCRDSQCTVPKCREIISRRQAEAAFRQKA